MNERRDYLKSGDGIRSRIALPDFTADEVNFLKDSVLDVIRQRVGFIRSALNQQLA
jgi:hypothetical protein